MERRQELSQYRLDEADRCLRSARLLFEAQDHKSAANRSYYCVFNASQDVFEKPLILF
ncbi:MAG: HEPN domain-containing protein [Oscillospiraceae bacterium]|nr:HEPN domain-containing protein [Oscillospiraceae bacterium]